MPINVKSSMWKVWGSKAIATGKKHVRTENTYSKSARRKHGIIFTFIILKWELVNVQNSEAIKKQNKFNYVKLQ